MKNLKKTLCNMNAEVLLHESLLSTMTDDPIFRRSQKYLEFILKHLNPFNKQSQGCSVTKLWVILVFYLMTAFSAIKFSDSSVVQSVFPVQFYLLRLSFSTTGKAIMWESYRKYWALSVSHWQFIKIKLQTDPVRRHLFKKLFISDAGIREL